MRSPLVAPTGATLAGLVLSRALAQVSVPLAALLAATAFALGGRTRTLAWGALGLAWGAVQLSGPAPPLRVPVVVVGSVTECRPFDAAWHCEVRGFVFRKRCLVASGSELTVVLPVAEPPVPGSVIRARGLLSPPREYWNGSTRALGRLRLWVESSRLWSLEEPPAPIRRWLAEVRRAALTRMSSGFDPRHAGGALARALILGDGRDLPASTRPGLARLGLAHLLAVSGVHVALVAGLVALLVAPLGIGARWAAAGWAAASYLLVVGPRASILRAAGMVGFVLVATLARRIPSPRHALAALVALFLLFDPRQVLSLGWQLTMAATASLLWLGPCLSRRWHRLAPRSLRIGLAASVSAQLGTLPWALTEFGRFVLVAPLTNVAAVPFVSLFLAVGLCHAAVALSTGESLGITAALLDRLAIPFLRAGELPPLPGSWAVLVPPVAALVLTAWLVCLALGSRGARLGLLLFTQPLPAPPDAVPVELVMIDVGQGDAFLLRDGPTALLVDGGGGRGPGLGARIVVPTLAALGVAQLAAVLLSHPDRDHCGGLVEVVREMPVGEIWLAPGFVSAPCAVELLSGPVRARPLAAGDERQVGRWHLRALHPDGPLWHGTNDGSLVVLAEASGRRLLLTGDIGVDIEYRLLRSGDDLDVDLLKLAHHGSESSSARRFLHATSPRLGLVSAGRRNRYGHPAERVVDRLRQNGIQLLRTDLHGMVRISWLPSGPLQIRTTR